MGSHFHFRRKSEASVVWKISRVSQEEAATAARFTEGPPSLGFRRNRRYQRLDVTKRKRERLVTVRVALNLRHVVRHHHSVKAHFFIDTHRFQHIDVAVIDERFLEVQKPSTDISEMDIEDFAPAAKVPDDI